jgi:hypothetical protein
MVLTSRVKHNPPYSTSTLLQGIDDKVHQVDFESAQRSLDRVVNACATPSVSVRAALR